jgi:hypothetical protein
MYLQTCGSFMFANRKKIGSADRKSAKILIFGNSSNQAFLIPQSCGFANWGTYLRIAQLWYFITHKILYTRGYCIR